MKLQTSFSHVAQRIFRYLEPLRRNLQVWRTGKRPDRQTDILIANAALNYTSRGQKLTNCIAKEKHRRGLASQTGQRQQRMRAQIMTSSSLRLRCHVKCPFQQPASQHANQKRRRTAPTQNRRRLVNCRRKLAHAVVIQVLLISQKT